jgi:hypothetical protein
MPEKAFRAATLARAARVEAVLADSLAWPSDSRAIASEADMSATAGAFGSAVSSSLLASVARVGGDCAKLGEAQLTRSPACTKASPADLSAAVGFSRRVTLGSLEGALWVGVHAVPRARPSVRAKESLEACTPSRPSEEGGVGAATPADWTGAVSMCTQARWPGDQGA